MADATQTAEVIARSFTPEAGVPGAILTPEQQKNQDAATVLRQRLAATPEDPLAALRPVEEKKRITVDISAGLEMRFGIDGIRDPSSSTRLDRARDEMDLPRRLTEDGFEALPFLDQQLAKGIVTVELNRRPAFKSLTDAERSAIAEEILKNPDHRDRLGELLSGRLNPKEPIEAEEKVKTAQEERRQAEEALLQKIDELTQTEADRIRVGWELSEFDPGDPLMGILPGRKYAELENLKTNETFNGGYIQRLEDYLKTGGKTNDEIEQLKTQVADKVKTAGRGSIASPGELVALHILDTQAELDRLKELADEQVRFKDQQVELQESMLDLQGEFVETQNARNETEKRLIEAETQKALQEESVVDGMRGLVAEATNVYLEEQIVKRYEERNKQIEAEKAATEDGDEKRLLGQIKTRWEIVEIRRGKLRPPRINQRMVDADMAEVISGDGPKAILEEMLLEGVTDPQEVARIQERLKDAAFAEKWGKRIAGEVIGARIMSGKLHEGEIRMILREDWGKEAVNLAIGYRKDLKGELEKIYGKTGEGEPTLFERIKKRHSNPLTIILLLLLGAVSFGALGTKYVAEEGAK